MKSNRPELLCAIVAIALVTTACTSSKVEIDYQARVDDINFDLVRQGEPVVSLGYFEDTRPDEPTRFGTVRGGFGNVLKTLSTEEPVVDAVKRAFRSGFKLYGQLAEDAPGRVLISADLKIFDTEMFVVPTTTIEIDITVSDFETDVVRFSDTFEIKRSGDRPGGLGINASSYAIKAHSELVLTELVNSVINDERFLAALRERS